MNRYTDDRLVPSVKISGAIRRTLTPLQPGSLFVKGPIPMNWISAAARLPGKSLHVAMAFAWLAGMKGPVGLKMSRRALSLFNVSEDAYRDALNRLCDSGLLIVKKLPGQRAVVQIVQIVDGAAEKPSQNKGAKTSPVQGSVV